MDLPCLIGICAAAAQTVDPAAAQTAADSELRELSDMVTWLGIIVLVVAQFAAPALLRLYRRLLLKLMSGSARTALGAAALDPRGASWNAETLLHALETQRLRVLQVLIVVVLIYSAIAGYLYAFGFRTERNHAISLFVSFYLFASFSAPVVLLGVSAANFARHFWTYFAPAAFAAVAMQIVVANVSATVDTGPPPDLLPVLGGIAGVTLGALAVRAMVPVAWWRGARAWVKAHRPASVAIGLVLLFVLLGALDIGANDLAEEIAMKRSFARNLLLGCGLAAVAITLCYFTLVDRSKRIVVPLLAAALFSVVALTVVLSVALMTLMGIESEGEGGAGQIALAIGLAFGASLMLAWFMLSWIGLAYEQKVFSDAQFQVFCWMISVAGVVIFTETLVYEDVLLGDAVNRRLALATLIALLAYWALMRWFVRPLHSDRRLLVLRVFAQDSRGERLLDALEYRWRFIGPIVLIGGPDIAVRTIDPAKAANFLRLKLKDTFVPNRQVLHKRVAAMDDEPDPDGRYRVNEFYCFDDLWKEAVQLLLDSSDAIVLDLRGFTAERQGTAYEIGLLASRGALARTVFLVNASTDMQAVRQAMRAAGGGAELPAGQVIEVESTMRGLRLVEALVQRMPAAGATDLTKEPALASAAGD
jgi:hypothetical protein